MTRYERQFEWPQDTMTAAVMQMRIQARNARLEIEARENAIDLMADWRRDQATRDFLGVMRPMATSGFMRPLG